jgi:hypothetical protein
MSAVRVILITVAGPRGHVDVGVRSDARPADLADALGTVIGVSPAATIIEHRSPPRPGVPEGGRARVGSDTALDEAGIADGDLVLFRTADSGGGYSWPEVQARPAEFGAGSPPPRVAALSSPPVIAARAPAPVEAALPTADARAPADTTPGEWAPAATTPEEWAPAATAPDVWAASPPTDPADPADPVDPIDPVDTRPDVWAASSPEPPSAADDVWAASSPEPPSAGHDVWTTAASSDVWSAADPRPADAWAEAEPDPPEPQSEAAVTEPDIGQAATGKRFMTAPKVSEPSAGRHARSRTAADEPQPDQDLDAAQGWRPAGAGPGEQDQAWWHGSQEVNPDDWRG